MTFAAWCAVRTHEIKLRQAARWWEYKRAMLIAVRRDDYEALYREVAARVERGGSYWNDPVFGNHE